MKYKLMQTEEEVNKLLKQVSNDKEKDGLEKWIESIKKGKNTNIFDNGDIEKIKTSKEHCYRIRVGASWRLIFIIKKNVNTDTQDIHLISIENNNNAYNHETIRKNDLKAKTISESEEYHSSSKEKSVTPKKEAFLDKKIRKLNKRNS